MSLTDADKNEMSLYVEEFGLKIAVAALQARASSQEDGDFLPIIGEIWFTLLSKGFGGSYISYVMREAKDRAQNIIDITLKEYKTAEAEYEK